MNSKVLIIIPAYNEEESIERVVDDLTEHYPQYDYLVVNDQVECAVSEIEAILTAAECRVDNRKQLLDAFR
jgi:guanylate kinase